MIVADTDVLIAALRGSARAQEWLENARADGPVLISVVTVVELTGGMRSAERTQVGRLIAGLRTQSVTDVIAWRAGEYKRQWRRSHSAIDMSDYLIAATADVLGVELATLNIKHYPMFKGLKRPFAP